ncbi:unnamed protein product [Mycetohabitans rhizoxinica HKI 454]|uniref:Uncharacterized protein n=1 Tax=Mycetohabitans rhizoxinica (strain DSM 19002 / CIP 109453 / HKI 454) TaxID=882378 RepID=E5AL68_MYCRK|nr:unnamed protein product [Mycetohabitans rhizoxinica HKI 454]
MKWLDGIESTVCKTATELRGVSGAVRSVSHETY